MTFTANDLAVLVPTKDRPEKMRALLQSIERQSSRPSQIVIVGTGKNVSFLKEEFRRLPIEYHHLEIGGQIRQRNFGIQQLGGSVKLVCLLDDDVVLQEEALEAMLGLFNRNSRLGAACFNVVNIAPFRFSLLKYLFGMVGKQIGSVTRAGYNTRITNVDKDYPVRWIIGGAACWKKEILQKHPYEEWDQFYYPINEDLYYSFPLSFDYPFAVCAKAKLEHYPEETPRHFSIAFGEAQIRHRFRLVRKSDYFSVALAYWASLGQILESGLRIFLNREPRYLKAMIGNIKGVFQSIFSRSPQ